jgi:hypothetical protein
MLNNCDVNCGLAQSAAKGIFPVTSSILREDGQVESAFPFKRCLSINTCCFAPTTSNTMVSCPYDIRDIRRGHANRPTIISRGIACVSITPPRFPVRLCHTVL